MSRRRPQLGFDAISIEGGLLTPDFLVTIADLKAPRQAAADYRVPRGIQVRDEIGRAWRIAGAHWADVESAVAAGGSVLTPMSAILRDAFAWLSLAPTLAPRVIEERSFPISAAAVGDGVPVVFASGGTELDKPLVNFGDGHKRRSAFGLVQEYLNATPVALWGVATNGLTLRITRDNASLTRPAWIEADLARIIREERYADFSALWLLLHESRFGSAGGPPHECPLEAWRAGSASAGTAARDRLRDGVESALRELGNGFLQHSANSALRERLQNGSLDPATYQQQLLRLVYRLIFLLVAEERELLHPDSSDQGARGIYRDGYSLGRLRERAARRRAYDRHEDVWASLQVVLRACAGGEARLALPALGGLFAAQQTPDLEIARIANRFLLSAIYRLTWLEERDTLVRINWRDMGTEELGSVYESLLELVPIVRDDTRTFAFVGDAVPGEEIADRPTRGHARKLTGSYYTPDSLVQALLDSALDPVAQRAEADADPERAILSLAVLDPACGSGHFLLGAARRLASRLARVRSEGTPSPATYRTALRDVITHCIYGVDKNEMAIELARIALWLEAIDPGRPLAFLDPHLVHGDALLGLLNFTTLAHGIPDEAFNAVTGDDKEVAKVLTKLNRAGRKTLEERRTRGQLAFSLGTRALGEAFAQLDELSDDQLAGVEAKRARYASLRAEATASAVALAADLFVGAFLMPKRLEEGEQAITEQKAAERYPTTASLGMVLEGTLGASHPLAAAARAACEERDVLHWPLAFPQVFARGGFDVVIGNPPWETMSPDRREFFATHLPRIAEMSPQEQEAAISELLEYAHIRAAWEDYCRELYVAVGFMKHSGRYSRFAKGNLGKGDFNVYRQFVELAFDACAPTRMAAQVVPENFYNGANAAGIRESMFESFRLVSFLSFENNRGVWFAGIDTRMKFAMYAAQRGDGTTSFPAYFGIRNVAELQHARTRLLDVKVGLLREFSPDALTIMEFSNQFEIDICSKLYAAFPHFGAHIEGLPTRRYMAEVHMGNDSELFDSDPNGLPVFQGSMVTHFDHRAKGYVSGHGRNTVWRDFPFGSSDKTVVPQWYISMDRIPAKCRERVGQYRIGFCDVGNATNQRALMATLIPPGTICGHKVPTITLEGSSAADVMLWLAAANALVIDFLVRMKVALTMSLSLMDSLPLPRKVAGIPERAAVAALAARLTLSGAAMASFGALLVEERELTGFSVEPCDDPEARALLEAELNARIARDLYRLSRDELEYVLDPSTVLGSDTKAETFRALRDNEVRQFGEYRTRRLVLEAWDRLVAGETPARTAPASRPALNPDEDLAFVIIGLVHASAGSIERVTLARAVSLLRKPPYLASHAPQRLQAQAAAWADERSRQSHGSASLLAVAGQLVERLALRYDVSSARPRVLLKTTSHTPAESAIDPWYTAEARLILSVLNELPTIQAAEVDDGLAKDEAAFLSAHVA